MNPNKRITSLQLAARMQSFADRLIKALDECDPAKREEIGRNIEPIIVAQLATTLN